MMRAIAKGLVRIGGAKRVVVLAVFDDGENYCGLREPNPHQAFGNGPHHCAGAHLSRRTVGAILLPMLFERFPNMTLPEPASVRWHGFGFRGPLNLPVLLQ